MAWTRDLNSPSCWLKNPPSLCFNNLSCNASSMAYIHSGSVIVCGLDGSHHRILGDDGGVRAYQACFCTVDGMDVLIVALNTGVQIWTGDAKRMMYFFAAGTNSKHGEGDGHHTQGITTLQDGNHILVGCSDGYVFIFVAHFQSNEEKIEHVNALHGHNKPVTCATSSKDFAATGDTSGKVVLWDANAHFNKEWTIEGNRYPVTALCTRDWLLAAAFSTGHIRLYSIPKRELTVEIVAHSRIINAMDLHPESMMVASVGEDCFLNVWELSKPTCEDSVSDQVGLLATSRVPNQLLTGVQFLNDGTSRIAATSYDCDTVHLWNKI